MNILPKKNWHVRNKDNIQKVRRDEAKAAEEAKDQEERRAVAEREQRTSLLRLKARLNYPGGQEVVDPLTSTGHFNFFQDAEDGKVIGKVNKEHEAEKKAEQEQYEKKIGLLTYLGQSAAEGQVEKPWYQKAPERKEEVLPSRTQETENLKIDMDHERKAALDPMNAMPGYTARKKALSHTTKNSSLQNRFITATNSSTDGKSEFISRGKLEYQSYLSKYKDTKSLEYSSKHSRKHIKDKKHINDKKHKKDKKHRERERKHKMHKRKKSHVDTESRKPSDVNIQKLRAERLKRENAEKMRTERVLSGQKDEPAKKEEHITDALDGRYNSQYNPNLAKQTRKKMGHFITDQLGKF